MNQIAAVPATNEAKPMMPMRTCRARVVVGLVINMLSSTKWVTIAGILTGTDKTDDQRVCSTWLQSNVFPPPHPATGDDVKDDHAKYELTNKAKVLQANIVQQADSGNAISPPAISGSEDTRLLADLVK
jgi:hypothetical protein